MIAWLEGQVKGRSGESIILNVHGVGYEVSCPLPSLLELISCIGEKVQLWIYTHVREDSLQLYGFIRESERQFFLSLLKINGVGPKMALNILSGENIDKIKSLIAAGDVQGLTKLPKVGKKTAEQMILTLKGELAQHVDLQAPAQTQREILSALVNLGYKQVSAEKVVGGLSQQISFEEGLRQSLQSLSQAGGSV